MIEQLRALGLSMASRYAPVTFQTEDEEGEPVTTTTQRYVCWTTDEAKANSARDLGATVIQYDSRDPECRGWEIAASAVKP